MNMRNRGFSLIELMVVVAIIGVLSAIAFPAYDSYVVRTNRAIAKSFLSQITSKQEQYFADNKQYADDMIGLGYSTATFAIDNRSTILAPSSTVSIYVLKFINTSGKRTYTVQAVPANAQANKDATCGTLSLDQSGTKAVTGSGTTCW